jgi:hypothetical protein
MEFVDELECGLCRHALLTLTTLLRVFDDVTVISDAAYDVPLVISPFLFECRLGINIFPHDHLLLNPSLIPFCQFRQIIHPSRNFTSTLLHNINNTKSQYRN